LFAAPTHTLRQKKLGLLSSLRQARTHLSVRVLTLPLLRRLFRATHWSSGNDRRSLASAASVTLFINLTIILMRIPSHIIPLCIALGLTAGALALPYTCALACSDQRSTASRAAQKPGNSLAYLEAQKNRKESFFGIQTELVPKQAGIQTAEAKKSVSHVF